MKTENVIGLVGLVAIAGFVALVLTRYELLIAEPARRNANIAADAIASNTNATAALSIADIATHATDVDCWVIIRAKVYNVTSYLAQHPGGAFRITPYCGKDATIAFETKDGTGTHSLVAENELVKLYVGEAPTSALAPTNANANTNTAVITNTAVVPTPPATSSITLDAQTIAKHSSPADCWIIVSKGVYAVTSYLNKHPGGASRITPYCGKDATTAFATQGGTGSHSSSASADLAALRIGTVGSTTTTKTITQVNSNASTLTPQSGERENEDD
ncbi:MAG: cytochrome b5-like heme/steroid binding domain-containing protein [Patescibacteria group bacterium]